MRISQHNPALGRLEYEEWPVLADCPMADAVYTDCWGGTRGGDLPGIFSVEVNGVQGDGLPDFRYFLELEAEDVGEILGQMPTSAVATVLGRLLDGQHPELVGAIVGQIIAHLARGRTA